MMLNAYNRPIADVQLTLITPETGHSSQACSHNAIHRRNNASATLVQYVQINHSRTYIRVAKQLLNCTYVITGFEQMGGK
jgi:hypothetical protein